MPTAMVSTRKNVANPSTTSIPPNAGPALLYAAIEAQSAASNARIERCPKAKDDRLRTMGSSTMRNVPAIVRTISGRKRTASCGLKAPATLTGTRHLHGIRLGGNLHPVADIDVGLPQNLRRVPADRRQEALGIDAHPDHHHDKW